MLFNFVHAIICTDSNLIIPTSSPTTAMQSLQVDCMQLFTGTRVPGPYRPLYTRLCSDSSMKRSVCSWKGVRCAAGIIRAFEYEERITRYVVDMGWIPPTTAYLRLDRLRAMNGWDTEKLPRDLRFLSLVRVGVPFDDEADRTINLENLPSKMEELIVIAGWYRGIIFINRLPKTMRFLHLSNSKHTKAYVVFENLPESLEALCISNFVKNSKRRETRIIPAGQKKFDSRIILHKHFSMEFQFMESGDLDLSKYKDPTIANIPSE